RDITLPKAIRAGNSQGIQRSSPQNASLAIGFWPPMRTPPEVSRCAYTAWFMSWLSVAPWPSQKITFTTPGCCELGAGDAPGEFPLLELIPVYTKFVLIELLIQK